MARRRIPTRERLNILGRDGGRCYLCDYPIDATRERWEIEHRIPLELGGTETVMDENLRPAHASCHKGKTRRDVAAIAKAKRVEARHLGTQRSRSPLAGGRGSPWKRKVGGGVVRRYSDRDEETDFTD